MTKKGKTAYKNKKVCHILNLSNPDFIEISLKTTKTPQNNMPCFFFVNPKKHTFFFLMAYFFVKIDKTAIKKWKVCLFFRLFFQISSRSRLKRRITPKTICHVFFCQTLKAYFFFPKSILFWSFFGHFWSNFKKNDTRYLFLVKFVHFSQFFTFFIKKSQHFSIKKQGFC